MELSLSLFVWVAGFGNLLGGDGWVGGGGLKVGFMYIYIWLEMERGEDDYVCFFLVLGL